MGSLGKLKIIERRPAARNLATGEAGPKIADAAVYVYSILGPGLEEGIYKECFFEELRHQGVPVERDVVFPVEFRGKTVESAFRADFVVGGQTIVFVIAEEKSELHNMQIRSLLKLSGMEEAFIVNFRVSDMRKGIMRAVVQKGNIGDRRANENNVN